MTNGKVNVGIVGCGNISGIYLEQMTGTFDILNVAACTDLIMDRARAKSEQFKGVKAVTGDQLLADKSIDIIVNLTTPDAHFDVAIAAVRAGKSVHNEKPLAITREQGRQLLKEAKEKGVLVGGAPDTFMGAGIQTCRKVLDEGTIGDPVAATAFMTCPGHESWHPAPEFYYKVGGGPMFDMGPYYLTALVSLIGPVKRVTGSARITYKQRTITSEPLAGTKIDVEVPTHVAGVMDFAQGAVGTIITSFDVWNAQLPRIEIYGTKGSLSVPDPNTFGGPVRVAVGKEDWKDVPLTHIYAQNSRGIAVADMAYALRSKRPHRANGEMAYHVLDIMHAFHDASQRDAHVYLESTCKRPAALPLGLAKGHLDA